MNWDNLSLILHQKYSKRVILRVKHLLQHSRDAKRCRNKNGLMVALERDTPKGLQIEGSSPLQSVSLSKN